MKKIKKTLSIWNIVISLIILTITVIFAPKIIKEKSLESSLSSMESYVDSIADNIDSTIMSYSKQLEQLNCYRINSDFEEKDKEELKHQIGIVINSRTKTFRLCEDWFKAFSELESDKIMEK